jgi:methionine-gamma-lyase
VSRGRSRVTQHARQPRLATRLAHAGTPLGAGGGSGAFGALGPAGETSHGLPIFATSNYAYPDARAAGAAAAGRAFIYSRDGNPTVVALEAALSDAEGAEACVAFGSGMGAVAAAVLALGRGGEVLVSEGIYGRSIELVRDLGPGHGLVPRFVAAWDTDAVAAALSPRTRVLLVESLTNPLLRVADVPALARLCRRRGVALVVDSTFTTPCLQRPLALGATVVVHSLSKYIGGHGDVIGGAALGDAGTMGRLRRYRALLGATLDPFQAWLAVRGLRTMPVRVERQCATAERLARALPRLPGVRAVHYPGLRGHPDHARARRLLARPGAMLAFDLGTERAARRFYDRVAVIGRAASLGEVSSLLTHPATFSHKSLTPAARALQGIGDGLLRLSVGLEEPEDLLADIRRGLGLL